MRRQPQIVPSFDENTCPVPDAVLSRLYRAEPFEIEAIAIDLPEDQRMQLAVFCYARTHLREVGRVVASVCNKDRLVTVAGRGLGSSIENREDVERLRAGRPPITLATRKNLPVIDHDEIEA